MSAYQAGEVTGFLLFWGAFFVLACYPLYRVAGRTHDLRDRAWMAWVPVGNVILMCRIARVTAWSAFVLLLALFPLVGFVYFLMLWIKIGQRFGRTGLGVVAGVLPLLGPWALAFCIGAEPALDLPSAR
jgi:hypothetical protein